MNDKMLIAQGIIIDIKKTEEERQGISKRLGIINKTLNNKIDLLTNSLSEGLELRAMTQDDIYIGQTVFYPYKGLDIAVITDTLDSAIYGRGIFMTKYGVINIEGTYVLDTIANTETIKEELIKESQNMWLLVYHLSRKKQSVKEGYTMTSEEVTDYNNNIWKVHKYIEKYRNWQISSMSDTIYKSCISSCDSICIEYAKL